MYQGVSQLDFIICHFTPYKTLYIHRWPGLIFLAAYQVVQSVYPFVKSLLTSIFVDVSVPLLRESFFLVNLIRNVQVLILFIFLSILVFAQYLLVQVPFYFS